MAWFDAELRVEKSQIRIAHFTDSHLFADQTGEYFGVNTALNFERTLAAMAQEEFDFVVFGGDLTQDHSAESYQLFARLVAQSPLQCPVLWVPGNHDDVSLLEEISCGQIFCHKRVCGPFGQVLLVNSKSETPAGWCNEEHMAELAHHLNRKTIVFAHHHPKPIDGYLDKHMLENGPKLLNTLVDTNQVVGLFHGHVHHEYQQRFRALPVFATPATSIQFEKYTVDWQQRDLGPAYRQISFTEHGIETEVRWLER
ncbi:metallophosphoesterase [Pseudoalteromonas piscicida]|uniref:3',5'-cyclic-nucleotide phosphodiesterase n=1 Tax=Pseudoalteromonas piscicida TaxID=43662 RepID=A0A2A5JW88_PSEO7|nr:metallophosphoesterase [Pseudoalteromonas piscicida]PCK33732.1 3',5'-cyclic-nucleotide phosphodiesterase [Pseudoalteromonas piscicida]